MGKKSLKVIKYNNNTENSFMKVLPTFRVSFIYNFCNTNLSAITLENLVLTYFFQSVELYLTLMFTTEDGGKTVHSTQNKFTSKSRMAC